LGHGPARRQVPLPAPCGRPLKLTELTVRPKCQPFAAITISPSIGLDPHTTRHDLRVHFLEVRRALPTGIAPEQKKNLPPCLWLLAAGCRADFVLGRLMRDKADARAAQRRLGIVGSLWRGRGRDGGAARGAGSGIDRPAFLGPITHAHDLAAE
jgi:hypothetical protein